MGIRRPEHTRSSTLDARHGRPRRPPLPRPRPRLRLLLAGARRTLGRRLLRHAPLDAPRPPPRRRVAGDRRTPPRRALHAATSSSPSPATPTTSSRPPAPQRPPSPTSAAEGSADRRHRRAALRRLHLGGHGLRRVVEHLAPLPHPPRRRAGPSTSRDDRVVVQRGRARAPGQQTVLDHLLDLLLVYALRDWFARPDSDPPGWYDALADPALGRVLRAIHSRPSAALDRASMASPRRHVPRRLRPQVRRRRRHPTLDLPHQPPHGPRRDSPAPPRLHPGRPSRHPSATRTEFAFSDAFKRHHGTTPGRWRAEHRAAAAGG